MDPRLAAEIKRFDATLPIERALMPPSSWYTDAAIYAHEQRAVFGTNWLAVARAAKLAVPGSVASGCVAGEPWLVARSEAGTLAAFHGTCRHKGNVLSAEIEGGASEIVCGYHGWAYGLDGRLVRAPRIAGIEDFDRAQMSLAPIAVAEWGPWIFVSFDPDAGWPSDALAPLTRSLEDTSWRELRYHSSASWQFDCNWKVYVDNYLDGGYHIGTLHPSLDAQLRGSHYTVEVGERHSVQLAPPSEGEPGERIGAGALYAFVYPNFMINRYGDCLEGNFVTPLGPARCRVDYDFFFADSIAADAARASMAESAIIQREDIAVSEAVQVGLSSRGFDRGRYAPRVERAEHHFHCLLSNDLRALAESPKIC